MGIASDSHNISVIREDKGYLFPRLIGILFFLFFSLYETIFFPSWILMENDDETLDSPMNFNTPYVIKHIFIFM